MQDSLDLTLRNAFQLYKNAFGRVLIFDIILTSVEFYYAAKHVRRLNTFYSACIHTKRFVKSMQFVLFHKMNGMKRVSFRKHGGTHSKRDVFRIVSKNPVYETLFY